MDVNICISVCVCYLIVVDLGEPIVCSDSARVIKDKSADGIGNGRVLLNSPVGNLNVAVNDRLVVENGGLEVTKFLSRATVKNIRLCNVVVARLDENRLNAVLDVLYRYMLILYLGLKVCCYLECKEINDILIVAQRAYEMNSKTITAADEMLQQANNLRS